MRLHTALPAYVRVCYYYCLVSSRWFTHRAFCHVYLLPFYRVRWITCAHVYPVWFTGRTFTVIAFIPRAVGLLYTGPLRSAFSHTRVYLRVTVARSPFYLPRFPTYGSRIRSILILFSVRVYVGLHSSRNHTTRTVVLRLFGLRSGSYRYTNVPVPRYVVGFYHRYVCVCIGGLVGCYTPHHTYGCRCYCSLRTVRSTHAPRSRCRLLLPTVRPFGCYSSGLFLHTHAVYVPHTRDARLCRITTPAVRLPFHYTLRTHAYAYPVAAGYVLRFAFLHAHTTTAFCLVISSYRSSLPFCQLPFSVRTHTTLRVYRTYAHVLSVTHTCVSCRSLLRVCLDLHVRLVIGFYGLPFLARLLCRLRLRSALVATVRTHVLHTFVPCRCCVRYVLRSRCGYYVRVYAHRLYGSHVGCCSLHSCRSLVVWIASRRHAHLRTFAGYRSTLRVLPFTRVYRFYVGCRLVTHARLRLRFGLVGLRRTFTCYVPGFAVYVLLFCRSRLHTHVHTFVFARLYVLPFGLYRDALPGCTFYGLVHVFPPLPPRSSLHRIHTTYAHAPRGWFTTPHARLLFVCVPTHTAVLRYVPPTPDYVLVTTYRLHNSFTRVHYGYCTRTLPRCRSTHLFVRTRLRFVAGCRTVYAYVCGCYAVRCYGLFSRCP